MVELLQLMRFSLIDWWWLRWKQIDITFQRHDRNKWFLHWRNVCKFSAFVGAHCALFLEFNECGFWHAKPFVSRSEHCLLPFTYVFKCQQRQLMNRVVLMNFSKCSKEGHFTPFRVISYSHISKSFLVMVCSSSISQQKSTISDL